MDILASVEENAAELEKMTKEMIDQITRLSHCSKDVLDVSKTPDQKSKALCDMQSELVSIPPSLTSLTEKAKEFGEDETGVALDVTVLEYIDRGEPPEKYTHVQSKDILKDNKVIATKIQALTRTHQIFLQEVEKILPGYTKHYRTLLKPYHE
ncbi:Mediator complex, subunit Med10 like protein [Aduncisulcus paluster]|uniref:Mediator of RNA polymerase II transcription subunit 10 n=1 Tax=Aduncisulcus paluster TaxID=2918883 RepID=A0ABQ5JRE5_9EUKA|nr:Mediator complex, subunit Med10 like protein [Aduncisulcus paluster]